VHRSIWLSATARVGLWVGVSVAAVRLVHNPTPTLADVAAAVPYVLLLTSGPGLLYVVLVRSWWGTVLAGIGIAVAELALFAHVSAAGASSSTAGVGLVALPPLLMLPVLVTVAFERRGRRGGAAVPARPGDGAPT
jgi:hypothetical protein